MRRVFSVWGGARGLGAEGKIKGLRSKWPLEPCLHINFYGAKERTAEREFWIILYNSADYTGSISLYFTELPASRVL